MIYAEVAGRAALSGRHPGRLPSVVLERILAGLRTAVHDSAGSVVVLTQHATSAQRRPTGARCRRSRGKGTGQTDISGKRDPKSGANSPRHGWYFLPAGKRWQIDRRSARSAPRPAPTLEHSSVMESAFARITTPYGTSVSALSTILADWTAEPLRTE